MKATSTRIVMPNLDYEIEQLRLANEHIEKAAKSVAGLQAALSQQDWSGSDTQLSQRTLAAAKDGFRAFVAHRDHIMSTIEQLRAGALPEGPRPDALIEGQPNT
jgi:hypothetical protein